MGSQNPRAARPPLPPILRDRAPPPPSIMQGPASMLPTSPPSRSPSPPIVKVPLIARLSAAMNIVAPLPPPPSILEDRWPLVPPPFLPAPPGPKLTIPALPQEILDKITDTVSYQYNDMQALKNLALVSQNHFLQRCRRHIFRRLRIDNSLSPGTKNVLRAQPSLLAHVRKLELSVQETWSEPSEYQEIWFNQRLRQVLDLLTGLETLCLHMRDVEFGYLNPSEPTHTIFNGPCKDTIARLFLSPKLVNVQINGFRCFPVRLIHSVTRLRSLHIGNNVSFSEENTSERPKKPWYPASLKCEHQSMSSIDRLLRSGSHTVYANLVNLQLCIMSLEGHTNALSILDSVSQNSALEMLDLKYTQLPRTRTDFVLQCYEELVSSGRTIPSLKSLRYINLELDLHRPRRNRTLLVPDIIPNMLISLLCKSPQPSLTVIDISFSWETPQVSAEQVRTRDLVFIDGKRGWNEIDNAFSNPALFPKLQALCMVPRFGFPDTDVFSRENWMLPLELNRTAIKAAFPRTRAREGVVFDAGERDTHFERIYEGIVSQREVYFQCFQKFY
ncbi:hypothetical protein D9611_008226 [Ephemerocybe angulata]|uniref:Uncharacterized protein n=1 Tax=Ephemerocybe angulata TaxID=980116 RepID=A0A8H5BJE9_9AGAR|nr:hypothetical protein D9611_008226 [Tulosesus angulatus]